MDVAKAVWRLKDRILEIGAKPLKMGILNVTPDSFSDGGSHTDPTSAAEHARKLIAGGADIIDIGGESTRPSALACPVEEEIRRVVPALHAIRAFTDIPITVDTRKSTVAQAALTAGANAINDVSGGMFDPDILRVTATHGAGLVLMHSRATPAEMQLPEHTVYSDLHGEIISFLKRQIQCAIDCGVNPECIILDPGIGFAKTAEQNIDILRQLPLYAAAFPTRPLLIGHSRKRFLSLLGANDDIQSRDRVTQDISNELSTLGIPLILRAHV